MDFAFTPDQQAFAEEVRGWLRRHPPADFAIDGMDGGYGSGAHSRGFLRALGAEGWISLCWPEAFGGLARPMTWKLVLYEELALAGAPFGPLASCQQTADSIISEGSDRLRRELLPRIARGEAIFWQGFSEPGSGSDLLSLGTEASRDGTDWVIRGHKIWSSHAGIATHGLVLARTDRRAGRAHGLTMFVVDNRTPGLDIRPIRSLTGEVYHYEVFLDGVRVPPDLVLGREHEGFAELLRGLDTDRFWGRFYKAPALQRLLASLVEYVNDSPLAHDAEVRRRLAALATDLAVLRLLFYRTGWMIQHGLPTPYETALGKVMADETGQRLAAAGMEILGLHGPLTDGSRWVKLRGEIQHVYQTSMGQTIAGGTSEIMRATIATRGLGLPRDTVRG